MQPPASPVYLWRLSANGLEALHIRPAPASLDEASIYLPGGVYTTFRTYAGCRRAIGLQDHLKRLEQSAQGAAGLNPGMPPQALRVDPERVRALLRQALLQGALSEARVRLSLDLSVQPGTMYLALQNLEPLPAAVYSQGVQAASSGLQRHNPKVKETGFLLEHHTRRQLMPQGVFELLLLDKQGQILEGMTSNFFGVRQGTALTAGHGVLQGVTRGIVLELLRQAGIPVKLEAVPLAGVARLDEAFITSSSRGVAPVVGVDGEAIGGGRPGPLAQELWQRYQRHVLEQAEDI